MFRRKLVVLALVLLLAWAGVAWAGGAGVTLSLIDQRLQQLGIINASGSLVIGGTSQGIVSITAGTGSPTTLQTSQGSSRVNNAGTTVKAACTLPEAASGLHYYFDVVDTDGLRINAATGDTIRIGDLTCASAGYFESVRVGSSLHLVAFDANTWVAGDGITGTWRADSTTSVGFAYTPTTWTSWTPTSQMVTNTTWTGRYRQVGQTIQCRAQVVFTGSPGATTCRITVPVGTIDELSTGYTGTAGGGLWDNSATTFYGPFVPIQQDSDEINFYYTNGTSTVAAVTNVAPVTIAASDQINVWFEYQSP